MTGRAADAVLVRRIVLPLVVITALVILWDVLIRVFVFTPRPGRVQEEVAIELPSPRAPSMKDTPEFLRHTATLRRALAKSS